MYKSLSEKAAVFNQYTINTVDELRNLVELFKKYPSLRFRGVCESKYTMLTSLQRQCPASMAGRQSDYLSLLLEAVKRDPVVCNFFNSKKIAINDISCLALMQHQGLPTPFLDFSTDVRIALSFAADGVSLSSSDVETDEYVSLYVFDKDYELELGYSIQQVYADGMERAKQMIRNYLQHHADQQVDASLLYNLDSFVKWNDIKEFELSFIEYQSLAPGLVTLSGQKLNLSNANLDRQKGCFILNLYDEKMPLEENWFMRTPEKYYAMLAQTPGGASLPFKGVMTQDKLYCFDIKKDVIKKWALENAIELYDRSAENNAIKDRLHNILTDLNSKN